MSLPKARSPKRYSRSVETTTRLLHVTAPLSCWHVLAVRLQIQNLVGGPGFEPGASRSRTVRAAKLRQPPTLRPPAKNSVILPAGPVSQRIAPPGGDEAAAG